MKRTVFVILAVLLRTAFAQQMWERTYGGAGNDYGYSVQQTTDSGYIVAGTTKSFGDGTQVYLIRTDASGDTLWTRTYGGAGYDSGYSVQQTLDGGYVVAGTTTSFGNGSEVYLIKTDTSGETLWTRTYGGSGDQLGYCVQQTTDSGYIIAGRNGRWVYLVKTYANGDTVWTRRYSGFPRSTAKGHSVLQTSDGGYIVAGVFSSAPTWYGLLVKIGASGDSIWARTYQDVYRECLAIQHTFDGHYVVAGYDLDGMVLAEVDTTGDTLWTRTYGGAGNDYGYSVQQATDSGYIVAGYTNSFGGGMQVYLIKTDSSGDTIWTRTYGGADDDRGFSVRQTLDGGFIVAGYTTSFGDSTQVYLIKTDPEGIVAVAEPPRAEVRATNAATIVRGVLNLEGASSRKPQAASLVDMGGRKVLNLVPGENDVRQLAPGVYFVRKQTAFSSQHTATRVRKVIVAR